MNKSGAKHFESPVSYLSPKWERFQRCFVFFIPMAFQTLKYLNISFRTFSHFIKNIDIFSFEIIGLHKVSSVSESAGSSSIILENFWWPVSSVSDLGSSLPSSLKCWSCHFRWCLVWMFYKVLWLQRIFVNLFGCWELHCYRKFWKNPYHAHRQFKSSLYYTAFGYFDQNNVLEMICR